MYILCLCKYPNVFRGCANILAFLLATSLSQGPGWCKQVFDKIQVGEFNDRDDYKLHKPDAVLLQKFLAGKDFRPFLTALDTDADRVENRRQQALSAECLKDQVQVTGRRTLGRWLHPDEEYDEEKYLGVTYPPNPLRITDWVHLTEALLLQGESQDDSIPRMINDLARYVHSLHYKVDSVRELVLDGNNGGASLGRDWEELSAKYPFLEQCDEHVRRTPNIAPMMLARTKAVTHLPCVRVLVSCVVRLLVLHRAC
jgi:hypothetical protein